MDWFSWLSKTSLEPALIYDYGRSFTRNELEEDDITHFNHEVLQSMGLSIAKHRLEILKLATKHKPKTNQHPKSRASRLVTAIKQAKTSMSKYFKASSGGQHCYNESSHVVVPRRHSCSLRWIGGGVGGGDMLKRDINGGGGGGARVNSFSSLMVDGIEKMEFGDDDVDEYYWLTGVEEIKWDAMFHSNMKPT